MTSIKSILNKYVQDVNRTIKEALEEAPDDIHGIISYHFGWVDQDFQLIAPGGGKMLRPTLALLAFEAITGSYRAALPVAAAIEMIHNFSLMHDDIEDNDRERRGQPTAWSIWGKPRVINVGDFLYSLAFKTLYQLDPAHFPPERTLAIFQLIIQACLNLTKGQELDLKFEAIPAISTDMYLDMVYKKTGALIEAAILSGVMLGTEDEALTQHYHHFAHNIGLAFQIRDDMLGIWGDRDETGKSTSNDLRRKKKTLPVIYLLDQAPEPEQARLRQFYARPGPLSDEEIEFVRASLERVGAYDYVQQTAATYQQKSFDSLHRVTIKNQAQAELETLARFLVDRTY